MEEATSLGAAILGGVGAGVYADVPSALEELRYDEYPVEPVPDEVLLLRRRLPKGVRQDLPQPPRRAPRDRGLSRVGWPFRTRDYRGLRMGASRSALSAPTPDACSLNLLVNHRCHLYQGTNTSTLSAGQAMLTARRPSLRESCILPRSRP